MIKGQNNDEEPDPNMKETPDYWKKDSNSKNIL
jgi:hypothetical protein